MVAVPGTVTGSGEIGGAGLKGRAAVHFVVAGGVGHREAGAVPPAASPWGEGRGVRGFVDLVGT